MVSSHSSSSQSGVFWTHLDLSLVLPLVRRFIGPSRSFEIAPSFLMALPKFAGSPRVMNESRQVSWCPLTMWECLLMCLVRVDRREEDGKEY